MILIPRTHSGKERVDSKGHLLIPTCMRTRIQINICSNNNKKVKREVLAGRARCGRRPTPALPSIHRESKDSLGTLGTSSFIVHYILHLFRTFLGCFPQLLTAHPGVCSQKCQQGELGLHFVAVDSPTGMLQARCDSAQKRHSSSGSLN